MDTPYYLLVQRGAAPHAGQWSFPGGKLELGETALDGARRELSEETRFDFTPLGAATRYNATASGPHRHVDADYDEDNDDKTDRKESNAEDWGLAWFSGGAFATADSITWTTTTTTTKNQ